MNDIRYGFRSLWRSKAFAVVAILCLGFGIGLNTTIFSIVDGVLLKPFPYTDPERLVVVEGIKESDGITGAGLPYADFRDVAEGIRALSAVGATQGRSVTLSDDGNPERFSGAAISANLFPLLGTSPVKGRQFRPEDDAPGAERVAILSDTLWTQRYHRDPDILGRTIQVNGLPTVVVGVMPEGFAFPQNQRIWIPLGATANPADRIGRNQVVFARLAPGASIDRATVEVAAMAGRLASQFPDSHRDWSARVQPLRARFIPADVTLVIWLMMAGVTLVLFIACSNVANLLLARGAVRRREMSVRTALGAGRGRIVRQLLVESAVLALASVPLGVVLAEIGTRLIAGAMPPEGVPYYIRFAVDARALVYTVAVALGTSVIFGLLPAWQVSAGALHDSLKEGTRGNSSRRSFLKNALVVVQVSLALVSLVGAMLFVRSFRNMNSYDVGFDAAPLMTMRVYLSGPAYDPPGARARRAQDIVDRIEHVPGVVAAFASSMIPVAGGGGEGAIVVEGRPVDPGREPVTSFMGVTPGFCKTLGVSLSRGRDFSIAEGTTRTAVAIINGTMATRFWPDANPVGARFRYVNVAGAEDWFTVIGVVADIKHGNISTTDRKRPVAYVPHPYQEVFNLGLTIRAAGPPTSVIAAVRDEIRAADPNIPVSAVQTMDQLRRLSYWQFGVFGWVFGTIGVVGLLLASVGVYGVLSYSVSQRTQEIGVRMALGADQRGVLRLIVRQGLQLTGAGVLVGLILAPAGTWVGRSLFYNVSPFDPLTFAGVAAFLLLVAMAASYLPARRATRVDPVQALRGE